MRVPVEPTRCAWACRRLAVHQRRQRDRLPPALGAADDALRAVVLREHPTGGVGAELITQYPFCFRSKVPAFDDLFVSAVEICLCKR